MAPHLANAPLLFDTLPEVFSHEVAEPQLKDFKELKVIGNKREGLVYQV